MPLCRVLLHALVKEAPLLVCWLAALSGHNRIMGDRA